MAENSTENAEQLLKGFGMTEYEVRAYLALLQLGIATAEQISEVGGIPLPRVYDTITELQRKGFVLISKSRPKKFKPIPVERALNHFVEVQKKTLDQKITGLRTNIKATVRALSAVQKTDMPEEHSIIWSMEKKKNITRILDEQKRVAKNEVVIFSGDVSFIDEVVGIFKDLKRRGVKIRMLVADPKTRPAVLANIKRAKAMGAEVRTGYPGMLRGHIIDSSIAAINIEITSEGFNIPGSGVPGSDVSKKYETLIFSNPVMVSAFRENFEFWWKSLK
jgi:sugar-specific transcriptional regulator TrmB